MSAPPEEQAQSLHTSSQPTVQPQVPAAFANQYHLFNFRPILMKCPFCLQRIKTEIVMKPELVSLMFALALFSLLPNAIMIILIVLVLQLTASKKHRCSLCQRQLGTDGKFLVIFKDEVFSFSLGQNGILISKKVLMTIGFAVFIVLSLWARTYIQQSHDWTELTWSDLSTKCPYSTLSPKCQADTIGKTVKNWKGYVMRVEDERRSMRRFYEHAIKLYVKMDPPEREHRLPDIFLTGSSYIISSIYPVLDQLVHGDEIIFNATFELNKEVDEKSQNRYLQIVGLERTGNNNANVQVYLSQKEEEQYVKKIEGKGLRHQN